MNIEFLRNFVALTRYQSFSDLARDLSISQSTLSHQIRQLELELGDITLIDRTTRKFSLTAEGKLFLEYAEKIIDVYDACKRNLSKFKEKNIEDIIITASTLPGSHILPKFIASFREKYPTANFKISINNSQKSIELLEKGMADFAGIGSFMNYERDKFDLIKIGEDSLNFICSPQHELFKNHDEFIKFNDLLQYPFITREKGSGTREIFESHFEKSKELNITLELDDNDSIISAVSDSNYISILSEHIAKKAVNGGLIKILHIQDYPVIAKRDIYFIKIRTVILNGLKKKFWEYLQK